MQVRIEKVAHGGHFIARNDGQVIFVRDTAPGELVEIEVTSKSGNKKGFLRANVLKVIEASPERITPPCQYAGRCGGCDFQHLNLPYQRKLKSEVIKEQFSRIAKMDIILLKMAITELQLFSSIPTKVTLNEYIEIAKFYSTPKSNSFINGILDKAIERLRKEKKIVKIGRGLID